jgi:hypothetical protein
MNYSRQCVAALLVVFLCSAGLLASVAGLVSAETANPGKPAPAQSDIQRLEGRWVRPDGGYILELRSVKKDGSVSAAYFNPRPIKVYRAEWSRKEGKISLAIELRDVNYPGSTYHLQYDPATERLKGTYFQAVERRNFNIEFVRVH